MGLWQDLQFAIRLLVKDKWFTLVAAVALALGIGVNATVFTFVNAVLIRGLPFDEPDRIMALNSLDPVRDRDMGVSYPRLQGLARRNADRSRARRLHRQHDERQRRGPRAGALQRRARLGQRVQAARRSAAPRPRLPPRGRSPGRRCGRAARQRHLEEPLRRRSRRHRPHHSGQRHSVRRHRRDAGGLQVSAERRSVAAARADSRSRDNRSAMRAASRCSAGSRPA